MIYITLKTWIERTYNYICIKTTTIKAFCSIIANIPDRISVIEDKLEEIRRYIVIVDRGVNELKDIDFIAIGR